MTLRIGIIGVGRIGSMHADLLAFQVDGTSVSCIFDADPARALTIARRVSGARVVPNVHSLLEADDVDAVAICSSTHTHADLIVAAAAAGKPTFCEKPISLDLPTVDRALSAVEDADVLLMVGFNRRFDPGHASVREAESSWT